MNRCLHLILSAALLIALSMPAKAVETSAASAILIEAKSGRVLYEQNANERRYIASITKLMTALVALESGHSLDEVVTIKPEYTGAEGSSMYLRPGEELKLETLMYGLLLSSGNDAALAVAGHCAGSVDSFVAQMNRRTVLLGMKDTTFLNPSGLTEEGHCSTAADMAKLAAACMQREEIARIVNTRSITVEGRSFTNHNKLLWRYDGCIGMKTGYTERSGRTLISCARRNGMTLIAVTLSDPNDWVDHTNMLDYGFEHYTLTQLSSAEDEYARVPVLGSLLPFIGVQAADTLYYPLTQGEEIRKEVSLTTPVKAPILKGQSAGTITYYLGDDVVAICPLVYRGGAELNVTRQTLLGRMLARIFPFIGR